MGEPGSPQETVPELLGRYGLKPWDSGIFGDLPGKVKEGVRMRFAYSKERWAHKDAEGSKHPLPGLPGSSLPAGEGTEVLC